jgi:hypothetical protein
MCGAVVDVRYGPGADMTARHSRLWAGEPFVCLADLPTRHGQSLDRPDIPKVPPAFCAAASLLEINRH